MYVVLHGWYAGKVKLAKAVARVNGLDILLKLQSRPDVAAAYRRLQCHGFITVLDCSQFDLASCPQEGSKLAIEIIINDDEKRTFHVPIETGVAEAIRAVAVSHDRKLEWLKTSLKATFSSQISSLPVWCLTDAQKKQFLIEETLNISSHSYDGIAQSMIKDVQDKGGMILDCGAGLRNHPNPNVITTEIVDYPSTDVICPNEELPFLDCVFDAVFSLNVLEHVANPSKSARELLRVLKPGGKIYAVVPFLQPEHGYPNHFYNMSREGLRSLFKTDEADDHMRTRVIEQWVSDAGHPIAALHWFLQSYAAGLPEIERKKFVRLSVKDLLARTPREWLSEKKVTGLSQAASWELACTTSLIVEKE